MSKDIPINKKDLFGNIVENNAWQTEWTDMPEFSHEKKWEYQSLIVRFYDEDGVQDFARLIKQNIYPTTKSLWFPTAIIEQCMNKNYSDES
jgi:hypothetical protein